MIQSSPSSPLLEMAMTYISECEKKIPSEQLPMIRETFDQFISGRISYPECTQKLTPIIGTTQPIDKIDQILRTPENPLPQIQVKQMDVSLNQMRAKTRPWTTYEDRRLLAGLHRFGFEDWALIAQFVGNGRSKAQCSQRWSRGLDPKITKDQWSEEQDSKLLQLIATYGDKSWTKIASQMGNRCDVQCRYRYRQLCKDDDFQEKMAQACEEANLKGDTLNSEIPKQQKLQRQRQQKRHQQPTIPMQYGSNLMYYSPIMMSQGSMPTMRPMQPMQMTPMVPMAPAMSMTMPMAAPMQPIHSMPQMQPMQNVYLQQPMQQQILLPASSGRFMPPQMAQTPPLAAVPITTMPAMSPASVLQPVASSSAPSATASAKPSTSSFSADAQPQGQNQQQKQGQHVQIDSMVTQQPSMAAASSTNGDNAQIKAQPSFQFDADISSQNSIADWSGIKGSPSGAFGINPSDSLFRYF